MAKTKRPHPCEYLSTMVARSVLTIFLVLLAGATQGQFWDFVYRALNGDTTAGPDYDTAYVTSYRNDLVLSPVMTTQGQSVSLARTDQELLRFNTNTPVQYGLALDYKWLGIEYTTSIDGMSTVDGLRGATETQGLGFGYTGRSWWFRNALRTSKGFHVEDPTLVDPDWEEGDPYPYRSDLRTTTYSASLSHGFNTRRYSHTAALWQMERQKRSAGSWVAGATFWYAVTEADGSLVPTFQRQLYSTQAEVNSVRRWVVGLTGGYTGTLSLWGRGFLHAMVLPGIGAQRQRVGATDGREADAGWTMALTGEVRLGAGYVADRWYVSLTAYSFQNTGFIAPDVQLGNGLASTRLALGWRFQQAGPFIPRIGL
jgi:hypothetical protein